MERGAFMDHEMREQGKGPIPQPIRSERKL